MVRPSHSEIQRAKEKAQLHGDWMMLDKLSQLEQRRAAELAPEPVQDDFSYNSSSDSSSWDLDEWLANLPSIAKDHTSLALKTVDSSDYKYWCKSCDARPPVAGPHHDSSCSRNQVVLVISSELAHKRCCRHCDATPYVAGAHHRRGCPRRVEEHIEERVDDGEYGYSTPCKHCGVKPFSQGPHHDSSCDRCWGYSAYSTKLAHMYECKECGARPFPAGPHHESGCKRYFR